MASPPKPARTTYPFRPSLLPLTAVALGLLLGCGATRSLMRGTPPPKAVEQTGQARTAVDGLEGKPIGLTNQEPIPIGEAPPSPGVTPAPAPPISAVDSLIPKAPPELAAAAAAAAAAALPPGEKFDEGNPTHRLARCRVHVARSEWFDAIGDCRKAAELAPKSAEPWIELMRIYVTIQSYGDGADAARAVLAREPGSAPAYYYLGWALSGGQDYPASIKAFRQAVSIDPRRVEYLQGLGITYCLADNFARGIATLEQARTLDPTNAKTKDLLGETRSQLAERLAPHQKAVKEKPEDPAAHAMLGSKLQQYGLAEKALVEYDSALAKIPSPLASQDEDTRHLAAALYYNRGVLYRDLGRGDAAVPAFSRSFEIDPALAPQAWYFIGLIAYDKGDNEGAIRALSKSVQGAPKVIENRRALALAYEKSGKKAAAKEQRDVVAQLQREAAEAGKPVAEESPDEAMQPQPAPDSASTGNVATPPAPAGEATPQPSSPNQDPGDDSQGAE